MLRPPVESTAVYFLDTPGRIWFDGFASVSLFFVLSGFVLSRNIIQKPDSRAWIGTGEMLRYTIGRFCRIWIPFNIFLFVCVILQPFASPDLSTIPPKNPELMIFWASSLDHTTLLRQITLIFFDGPNTLFPQAWTLSIELVLSLFVPLLAIGVSRSLFWVAAVYAISFSTGLIWPFLFALGTLVAALEAKGIKRFERHVSLLLIVGLWLYTFRFGWPSWARNSIVSGHNTIWATTAIGSAMIILAILASARLQRLLSI